jgi:hypothetical protein
MSLPNAPKKPRRPTDAENAMEANARSRDRQGKADDRALRRSAEDAVKKPKTTSPRGRP